MRLYSVWTPAFQHHEKSLAVASDVEGAADQVGVDVGGKQLRRRAERDPVAAGSHRHRPQRSVVGEVRPVRRRSASRPASCRRRPSRARARALAPIGHAAHPHFELPRFPRLIGEPSAVRRQTSPFSSSSGDARSGCGAPSPSRSTAWRSNPVATLVVKTTWRSSGESAVGISRLLLRAGSGSAVDGSPPTRSRKSLGATPRPREKRIQRPS